jgi:hypothetical protein
LLISFVLCAPTRIRSPNREFVPKKAQEDAARSPRQKYKSQPDLIIQPRGATRHAAWSRHSRCDDGGSHPGKSGYLKTLGHSRCHVNRFTMSHGSSVDKEMAAQASTFGWDQVQQIGNKKMRVALHPQPVIHAKSLPPKHLNTVFPENELFLKILSQIS